MWSAYDGNHRGRHEIHSPVPDPSSSAWFPCECVVGLFGCKKKPLVISVKQFFMFWINYEFIQFNLLFMVCKYLTVFKFCQKALLYKNIDSSLCNHNISEDPPQQNGFLVMMHISQKDLGFYLNVNPSIWPTWNLHRLKQIQDGCFVSPVIFCDLFMFTNKYSMMLTEDWFLSPSKC